MHGRNGEMECSLAHMATDWALQPVSCLQRERERGGLWVESPAAEADSTLYIIISLLEAAI